MKERYQRFYDVLRAKEQYSINCELCPIRQECYDYTENLTITEAENAPCCEELLFNYIMTGEKPKNENC